MGFIMAEGACLLDGSLRSRYDVLLLDGLDPKPGRKISQVRDESYKRPPGINGIPALADLAIEVRNDGNEEIRRMFAPEFLKQANHGPVEEPNRRLKHPQ